MLGFTLKKSAVFLVTLWAVVTLTFILMKNVPGDPLDSQGKMPVEIYEQLRAHYGLEKPLFEQYLSYLKQSIRFDFGPSMVYENVTVGDILRASFPASLWLGVQTLFFALFTGILLGMISNRYYGLLADKGIILMTTLALAIPSYLLAAFLQYTLAYKFGWLPVARWGSFSQSILPTLALGILPAGFIARMVRKSIRDILKEEYIKTALSKGLSWPYIFWHHCLPNALSPVVSYMGQIAASVLTGSFVVEKIFSIPGLGQWLILSVSNRDYPIIMGLTIFYSVILLTTVLIADLLHAWLDPRITFAKKARFA